MTSHPIRIVMQVVIGCWEITAQPVKSLTGRFCKNIFFYFFICSRVAFFREGCREQIFCSGKGKSSLNNIIFYPFYFYNPLIKLNSLLFQFLFSTSPHPPLLILIVPHLVPYPTQNDYPLIIIPPPLHLRLVDNSPL